MSTATVPVTAPLSITASITGVGHDSTVPDRADALDLELHASDVPGRGELIGNVTLLRDPQTGEHGPWGSEPGHWADDGALAWLCNGDWTGPLDPARVRLVVTACREAIRLEQPFDRAELGCR